jgi:hypothetical protein
VRLPIELLAAPRKYLARKSKSAAQFSHISLLSNEPLGNKMTINLQGA